MHRSHRLGCALLATLSTSCGRIGFETLDAASRDDAAVTVVDAGLDAAAPDAATRDAMAAFDAEVPDAASARDATLPMDAGAAMDAASGLDASMTDATASLDATADDDGGAIDAGPPPPPGDFCEPIPLLASDPVLDGELEPGLTLREPPREGWTGTSPIPAEHRAAYALAYRPDGLYFFVSVVDSTPVPADPSEPSYWGDGIEIYVDDDGTFAVAGEYDVPGTVQFIVAAPASGVAMAQQGDRWNNGPTALGVWTSTRFGSFRSDDTGYSVEGVITAADLDLGSWSLSSGSQVAVALGVNIAERVNDPAGDLGVGHRLGQYFSRLASTPRGSCGTAPFCTGEALCVTHLLP